MHYQSVDTSSQLLSDKRTKFRVEIRRKRIEDTFQQKRSILIQNKDLELLSQFALHYYTQQDDQETFEYLLKIHNYADSEHSANLKSLITISNLNYIIQNCSEKLLTIILQIYQKIYMPQCLTTQLLGQIQKLEDSQITEEFARFLLKIAQNNSLNILIEQYDFINYLLDVSLLLDNYDDWFLIVEELSKYRGKSSYYFKKLIIPAFKLIEYDNNYATLQFIVCMCQNQQNNKDSINYLLVMPGFIKWVIECIEKKQQSTLYIISVIIEESDEGTIQLIQEGLLKILSNLYYEMIESQSCFIYIIANICYIKNNYVISEVVQSEIFQNILALTDRELLKDDYISISQMLIQLIRKYTNESLYYYLLNKTDFVHMLGYLLTQYQLPTVYQNTIYSIVHVINASSEDYRKDFRMVI